MMSLSFSAATPTRPVRNLIGNLRICGARFLQKISEHWSQDRVDQIACAP
jgi:hypothetical protein